MLELCGSLTCYPAINEALRRRCARGDRQALVTVNPDLFRHIARIHGLQHWFDVIVASWEYGTDDKIELCHLTLELIGDVEPDRTILIDNLPGHINAWMRVGGHGYVFRDDSTLVDDVLHHRVPGSVPPMSRRDKFTERPWLATPARHGDNGATTASSGSAGD